LDDINPTKKSLKNKKISKGNSKSGGGDNIINSKAFSQDSVTIERATMRSILETIQKEWLVVMEKAKKLKAENMDDDMEDDSYVVIQSQDDIQEKNDIEKAMNISLAEMATASNNSIEDDIFFGSSNDLLSLCSFSIEGTDPSGVAPSIEVTDDDPSVLAPVLTEVTEGSGLAVVSPSSTEVTEGSDPLVLIPPSEGVPSLVLIPPSAEEFDQTLTYSAEEFDQTLIPSAGEFLQTLIPPILSLPSTEGNPPLRQAITDPRHAFGKKK